MTLFLGVDGGGTKTAFVLADGDGRVLARDRQPTTYSFGRGTGVVETVLDAGVRAVTTAAGVTPDAITRAFVGLPGYGESSADLAELDAIPGRVLGHDRYACGNDMLCGWAGSLDGADGVNVVAGTGSIAYGEHAGRTARAGGWSELFGDEGSAYWVAVRALNAFGRMADGRLPRTLLHERLRARIGVDTDLDVIGEVMDRWGADRGAVADLAKVVTAAADDGDTVALRIVEDAAVELVALVSAVADAVAYGPDERVPVATSGGMFSSDRFADAFRTALHAADDRFAPVTPAHGPDVGSVLCAMRAVGAPAPDRWSDAGVR